MTFEHMGKMWRVLRHVWRPDKGDKKKLCTIHPNELHLRKSGGFFLFGAKARVFPLV